MISKFWIRWGSIALIIIAYYLTVLYFGFIFSFNFSETLSQGGNMTSAQCIYFAKEQLYNHNNSTLASLVGFGICVPLILLIFKKVR